MGKSLLSIASFAVLAYVVLCAFLWLTQRGMIYFPTPASDPGAAESLSLASHGETLRVLRVGGQQRDALVYFGGNAENAAWTATWFAEALPDRSVYLADYRGYGGSSGNPSEATLYADAETVFDHVAGQHDSIAVMGRSLGSGVATYVASRRDIEKLLLVTPFDSMVNVASDHYPVFPVSLLLRDRYESAARVSEIGAPTLIVIAKLDNIIPAARSGALADAFPPAQVELVVFDDANHNDVESTPGYRDVIARFLERGD